MLCDKRLIVLRSISLLILLGPLGISCNAEPGETLIGGEPESAGYQLAIDPHHRECGSDADCIVVASHCSSCECGAPVNRRFRNHYERQYRELCDGYSGAVCEFYCPTPHSRCIEESCELSQAPPS